VKIELDSSSTEYGPVATPFGHVREPLNSLGVKICRYSCKLLHGVAVLIVSSSFSLFITRNS
jgi:hypothetical protein